MPQTANKGYEVQTTGSNSGTWGSTLNDNMIQYIDQNMGGITSKSLSSTPVTLSASEARTAALRLTGTLTANVVVTTSCLGFFYVENRTTGNFYVQLTNGSGATYKVPQSCARTCFSDATNGIRPIGLDPPGTSKVYRAGSSGLHPSFADEYLLEDGSAVSRTTYADLFNTIGTTYGPGNGSTTFNLPDSRGRADFGKDDMGGSAADRITSAGSGIAGTTLGATGGAQNVTIAQAGLPNITPTISIVDPGHSHAFGQNLVTTTSGSGTNAGTGGSRDVDTSTSPATTGITATSSSINGGVTQTATITISPVLIATKMIKI